MSEIRELVDKLNHYRDAYYNRNESLISDLEYDMLFDQLVKLEEETGIVYSDSPTVTVGYEVASRLEKVRHGHLLLSLDKTTDSRKFSDYFGDKDVCIMAKLDGLTVSLTYRDGELVLAESRGNGEVGEDITQNAKVFSNIPLKIPYKGEVIVDGECIIDYDTFDKINQTENTQYKNPRNLVSGTVRQYNSEIVANRKVKFIAWKLYNAPSMGINEFAAAFKFLKEDLGFEVVPYKIYYGDSAINADDYHDYVAANIREVKAMCEEKKYPTDGIVGAFNDISYGNSLGGTGHHPKHSLAYKFYQEQNETTLLDIEWNTSRTGLVNPVAIFEPVEIDGTTVSRATLNNVSIIKELQLGIGDTITVIKANQIIPMITENLTRSDTYELPKICPICGSPLTIKNDNGREMLYCTNDDCFGIRLDKISNYASREGLNIVGLSDERLRILMQKGFITDFASLYSLEKYRAKIEILPLFGFSSVDNLLKAINDSIECKFTNVLVGIGIPNIGKSTSKIIASHCASLKGDNGIFETFLNMACSNYDWSHLDNFGEVTSSLINSYIQKNIDELRRLVPILKVKDDNESAAVTNILGGKTFCITGKLLQYNNRDALVMDIEKYGGKVVSGVTSKTDYLITNEPDSGSSKNQNAKKFGTKIITEKEFIEILNLPV